MNVSDILNKGNNSGDSGKRQENNSVRREPKGRLSPATSSSYQAAESFRSHGGMPTAVSYPSPPTAFSFAIRSPALFPQHTLPAGQLQQEGPPTFLQGGSGGLGSFTPTSFSASAPLSCPTGSLYYNPLLSQQAIGPIANDRKPMPIAPTVSFNRSMSEGSKVEGRQGHSGVPSLAERPSSSVLPQYNPVGMTANISSSPSLAISSAPATALPALRRGKWHPEEEEYTVTMIEAFIEGLLPLQPGTTLRGFIAEQLFCDPMRVTKKLATMECGGVRLAKRVGKRTFTPYLGPNVEARRQAAMSRLAELRLRFFWRIGLAHSRPHHHLLGPSVPSSAGQAMGTASSQSSMVSSRGSADTSRSPPQRGYPFSTLQRSPEQTKGGLPSITRMIDRPPPSGPSPGLSPPQSVPPSPATPPFSLPPPRGVVLPARAAPATDQETAHALLEKENRLSKQGGEVTTDSVAGGLLLDFIKAAHSDSGSRHSSPGSGSRSSGDDKRQRKRKRSSPEEEGESDTGTDSVSDDSVRKRCRSVDGLGTSPPVQMVG